MLLFGSVLDEFSGFKFCELADEPARSEEQLVFQTFQLAFGSSGFQKSMMA